MRRLILRNGQSPGDLLTMTRAVGDLKAAYPDWEIDVESPCAAIWENNPHLTQLDPTTDGVEIIEVDYGLTADVSPDGKASGIHTSGWRGQHFTSGFHDCLERQLGVSVPQTSLFPELFLSDEERGWINQARCDLSWDGPFWLINAGCKPDNELKQYHRWQEVADEFNARFHGEVRLIQIGHSAHPHPRLTGVWSLVGRTDLRQLIRLAYWSHGIISPISFPFVLAAALRLAHVVVAGGKEGVRWQMFPHGRYLHTNGALPCCAWDGCWLGGARGQCKDRTAAGVPRCFDLITPTMIVDAVEMYYLGGSLSREATP